MNVFGRWIRQISAIGAQWDESDMATPEAAKDLFAQLGLVQLMHVYIVKVLASRKGETSYHGA